MNNFMFHNPTKIIFGKNTEQTVGKECLPYGKKILLHYGGGSIKTTGLYNKILQSLEQEGIEVIELGGVVPNPRVALAREGIKLCREEEIGFILAVGGGSVIDSAKAIAAGVHHQGDVWDFFEGKAKMEKCLPIGVVLTIPAAGSESSPAAVVSNDDGQYKRGIWNLDLRPRFAICNPQLTTTLPPFQTACGLADMLAHVMERYFTRTKNVDLSDRLCEGVMKTIINQGPKVMENPLDYEARAQIMWAGTVAHGDLIDCGREGDWGTHSMEHELSGIYDIAHGAGLSILFPGWIAYMLEEDLPRFTRFAVEVFRIDQNYDDPLETARQGVEALEDFFRSIGLPVRLKEVGIDASRIPEMAAKATANNTETIGSFKPLKKQDIEAIMNSRL